MKIIGFSLLMLVFCSLVGLGVWQISHSIKRNSACADACGVIRHKVIDNKCHCLTEEGYRRESKGELILRFYTKKDKIETSRNFNPSFSIFVLSFFGNFLL